VIVDTGVFVAAANGDEPRHNACAELLQTAAGHLVVPAMVVAEATYMIEQAKGPTAEAAFIRSLRSSRYRIEAPTDADLQRIAELIETYADLPLGGTDASVIALAERLGQTEVATLDRRHFTIIRPAHVPHFTLLPE
jgi:predicted nucleic acid-binding protein